jgi:hypothetical protein
VILDIDIGLECPQGHPIDEDQVEVLVGRDHGPGPDRSYAIIRCRQCPTYRGEYRFVPFVDRLREHRRAGRHVYRLPS